MIFANIVGGVAASLSIVSSKLVMRQAFVYTRSSLTPTILGRNFVTTRRQSAVETVEIKQKETATKENKKRNTRKGEDSRKTYLLDVYKYFWNNNDIVLFAHHNNLLASENEQIRRQLHKVGKDIQIRKLKTKVFRYFLRASTFDDPASKATWRKVKRKKIRHPLEALLKGPTALILIKSLDPKALKGVWKVLKKQNDKLFLLGGRIGQELVDLDGINKFKELSSLPELRAQLVGLLAMSSGAGIVKTLQSASSGLAMTLESRRNQLEDKNKEQKKE